MAEEWHYARNGEQFGPVSGEELRRMASAGELEPTDQIWKDGMPKWATANKLKGLSFPAAVTKNTSSGPPPLEQQGEKKPSINETLKAAGSLAANQAKKTQITSVSLPVTFQKLGKYVFDQRLGQDLFKVEFDELDAQAAKLRELDRDPKSDATAPKNSLGESAKALAQSAADAAKKKMASVRFDQSLTRLGKRAYEERGKVELPQPAIDKISQLYDQVNSIDEIIQTTTVPNPGWSVLENRFVHSVLGVLFFPVGLFLIWRSDLWSKRAKFIWTVAIAFFLTVGSLVPKNDRNNRYPVIEQSDFSESDIKLIEENSKFLSQLPSGEWFDAANKRGLSRDDFYLATKALFTRTYGPKFNFNDRAVYERELSANTGKRLEDY